MDYEEAPPASIHPNLKLLSYNSQKTLHGCPRKFFLYRLLKQQLAEDVDSSNIHFDFGSLVGYGTQRIFVENFLGEKPSTFFPLEIELFRQWKADLEEGIEEKQKKSFFHALHAVERFRILSQSIPLKDYELVSYNRVDDGSRQYATELGFLIDLGDGFSYRGFLDALLRHKQTGRFAVWECKTTRNSRPNEAEFKNSSQGLGYSVVVDAIAARLGVVSPDSYEIIYGIYKTTAFEWEIMKFTKSFTQRALWIRDILLDMKRIADYSEANYWPLYGEHCFSYFRACEYFDVCNMSDSVLLDDQPKLIEEEEGKYEFKFTLAELITAQLEKSEKQKEAEQKEEADEA